MVFKFRIDKKSLLLAPNAYLVIFKLFQCLLYAIICELGLNILTTSMSTGLQWPHFTHENT